MKIHEQIKTRLRFISAYLGQTSFGSDSKSSLSKKRHDNLYIPNYKMLGFSFKKNAKFDAIES